MGGGGEATSGFLAIYGMDVRAMSCSKAHRLVIGL